MTASGPEPWGLKVQVSLGGPVISLAVLSSSGRVWLYAHIHTHTRTQTWAHRHIHTLPPTGPCSSHCPGPLWTATDDRLSVTVCAEPGSQTPGRNCGSQADQAAELKPPVMPDLAMKWPLHFKPGQTKTTSSDAAQTAFYIYVLVIRLYHKMKKTHTSYSSFDSKEWIKTFTLINQAFIRFLNCHTALTAGFSICSNLLQVCGAQNVKSFSGTTASSSAVIVRPLQCEKKSFMNKQKPMSICSESASY